jgi:ketosteroid isomerase-like protein
MKTWPYLLSLSLLLSACATVQHSDPTAAKNAIRAVLDQQVKDWNEGNVEQFMRGYQQAETTRFASGANIAQGWQTVLERYKKTYPDKAAMGHLRFSDIDITVVSSDAALVFGRWHLDRAKDELNGLFTLFFRQTPEGWRIVHDHTSAAPKN